MLAAPPDTVMITCSRCLTYRSRVWPGSSWLSRTVPLRAPRPARSSPRSGDTREEWGKRGVGEERSGAREEWGEEEGVWGKEEEKEEEETRNEERKRIRRGWEEDIIMIKMITKMTIIAIMKIMTIDVIIWTYSNLEELRVGVKRAETGHSKFFRLFLQLLSQFSTHESETSSQS